VKFSEALAKYGNDSAVKALNEARIACQHAGCYDEEFSIFTKLVNRLKELSGKPIAIGV
jgi:hypothetical protein